MAEVTSTATSIDRLLACTVVSWPQRKASAQDQRSSLAIIVVLASLRLGALARWTTAWAAAGSFRVGRQVTTRCQGLSTRPSCGSGAGTKRCTRTSGSTTPHTAAIPGG
jgi:hypothetical protein